jgi:hypothetical protein
MSKLSAFDHTIDPKIYIKYMPVLDELIESIPLFNRKAIYIFNCEHNKYFITYATTALSAINDPIINSPMKNNNLVYVLNDGDINLGYNLISFFVNKNCPNLNECDFIKYNKIINMKEIKMFSLYAFDGWNYDSGKTTKYKTLKLLEIYENYLDNLVIKYMYKYGIDNVRGGSFSEPVLTWGQIRQIKNKFKKLDLNQIDGESTTDFNGLQIKLKLTTKYLNMNSNEDILVKPTIEEDYIHKEISTQEVEKKKKKKWKKKGYRSQDMPKQNMPKQDMPKQNMPKQDMPKQDMPKQEELKQVDLSDEVDLADLFDEVDDIDDVEKNYDLSTILEDLNKMSLYDHILKSTKEIDKLSFNTVKLYSTLDEYTQYKDLLRIKFPMIDCIETTYRNICTELNITKYFENCYNLTTEYLNLKAELKYIKLELDELNSRYGSIDNLQQIVEKEISNPKN